MRWQRNGAPREHASAADTEIPRFGAWVSVPLGVLGLFSIAVRTADSSVRFQIDQARVLRILKQRIAESAAPKATLEPAPLREIREIVRPGDTFSGILARVAILGSDEVSRWVAASRDHPSLSRLQPGRAFTFLVPSGTDRLAGLQYELSPVSTLVMRAEGDRIVAEVERLPSMVDVEVVAGTIETNLYTAAVQSGVPDGIVSAVADIFGWEIDFTSDLRRGDRFRIAYEVVRDPRGKVSGYGKVLAAELDAQRAFLRAVYYEAEDDGGNYYSPDGHPFGRAFLRYPLEFTRISSQFTYSRFHPILGVRRPHLGVDFAAPMGTPVRSIGAGTVRFAGWQGANGRFVKIDHGNGLESVYAHLKAIASGIRPGTRVQMGQVIGSVGASGLATGPHLHFALFRNGRYVDPMNVRLPEAPPLAQAYRSDFERKRDELLARLAAAAPTEVATASSARPSRTD